MINFKESKFILKTNSQPITFKSTDFLPLKERKVLKNGDVLIERNLDFINSCQKKYKVMKKNTQLNFQIKEFKKDDFIEKNTSRNLIEKQINSQFKFNLNPFEYYRDVYQKKTGILKKSSNFKNLRINNLKIENENLKMKFGNYLTTIKISKTKINEKYKNKNDFENLKKIKNLNYCEVHKIFLEKCQEINDLLPTSDIKSTLKNRFEYRINRNCLK